MVHQTVNRFETDASRRDADWMRPGRSRSPFNCMDTDQWNTRPRIGVLVKPENIYFDWVRLGATCGLARLRATLRRGSGKSGQQLRNNLINNDLNAKNAKDTKSNQTGQPLAGLISLDSAWQGLLVVCCVNVHAPRYCVLSRCQSGLRATVILKMSKNVVSHNFYSPT
jgi:hypothetical protein